MIDARTLLQEYHFDVLKDMAELLAVPVASNKKAAYVEALAPILFSLAAIQRGLSLLGAREYQALAVLRQVGGRAEASGVRAHLLRAGVIEPAENNGGRFGYPFADSALAPESQRRSFAAVIGRLMACGLVCGEELLPTPFSNRTKIYYDNVRTLTIPEQVAQHLPDLPVPRQESYGIDQQVRVESSSARAFQRDLYFYWSTAHTSPLSLTKDDRLYKRDLRLVNSALLQPEELEDRDEPDVPRLLFLRRLLTSVGLLRQRRQTIEGIDEPPYLGLRPTERIVQALERWRDGSFWNELLSVPRINVLGVGSRLDPVPEPISRARSCVLEHVAELHNTATASGPLPPPEERWVPLQRLVDSLRIADYGFLFPRNYRPSSSTYYTYYGYTSLRSPYISYGNEMGWSISPRFEDEADGWEVVEVGFICSMLIEPLHWMGLVDLAYGGDHLIGYRLTPAGEWALGVGPEITIPKGEGKVIVQPNFEVYALDPISDLTLAKLDEFSDRVTADRVIKYRLSRDSVYRAQRRDWTSERILHTLDEMSDTPLPQNVVRTLQEWQTIHERIRVHRRRSLLQVADGSLLDELMDEPRIRSRLGDRPDDAVALIAPRPGETEQLVHELQALGYPPARTRSPKDRPRPSFTIDTAGQLHFTTALPSIYLYQQIAPFTARDEQGRSFLTQSAVESAIEGGLSVDDILDRLRARHVGPIPRWVEIKVRAWGRYYGDAALQTVILVQLADEATLRELLAEPELRGLLRPFAPAAGKALALVSTGDLESLYEALRERNISLADELE